MQPPLPWPEDRGDKARGEEVTARFWEYHHRHPIVYRELVAIARQWVQGGRDQWSIWSAFAVLRWQRRSTSLGLPDPDEAYKISNDFTPYYARLIMALEPDLEDVFEVHQMKHYFNPLDDPAHPRY